VLATELSQLGHGPDLASRRECSSIHLDDEPGWSFAALADVELQLDLVRQGALADLASKGSLMLDSTQSSEGVVTKPSTKSVAQIIDGLTRVIEERGFTLFRVIDHSGTAERAGVQMPESKLLLFGKPSVGAAVMVAAPPAGLDFPLKVLAWEDRNGAVSVSYNSPEFLAERHHIESSRRAPFEAAQSIVDAVVGP
jgi:uncharacterized protein (DUF302 family)